MNQKLVIANWKMNGNLTEIRVLLHDLFQNTKNMDLVEDKIVICPPFCYASFVIGRLAEMGWLLGAQDCSSRSNGAFTGEISAEMLKDIGCNHVLVGHSERRQHHHEDNNFIHTKMQNVFNAGMMPVLCIGETLEQREAGQALNVIQSQLFECLGNQSITQPFIVAYEPVWAIGTGKVAQLSDIQEVHNHIKKLLETRNKASEPTPILYGGSVNAQNAHEILQLHEVEGVLVGGASLKVADFTKILESALC